MELWIGNGQGGDSVVPVEAAGFVEELEVEGCGGLAVDGAGGDGHGGGDRICWDVTDGERSRRS